MKRLLSFVFGMAALAALTAPVSAQNWPTQRVTIVVPFGAGSVTDILARIFAEEMGKHWGQQVIVENRPGLAGTAAVAKAAPDGYTLMVTSNGHTVSGLVTKDAPFDPVKDFAGITRLGSAPLFLITPPDFSAKTLKEIIDLAKKEPGKLNFSSPGLASTTFIAGALFRKVAGVNIVHVPFRSAPDAVTAVMRGDAQLYFAPVNLARDQSAAGKVNAVAAATAQRIPDLASVPTFTEAGLPFVYDSWFGLMAQRGVPKAVLDKISKDWAAAIKTPEMQSKLKSQFLIGVTDTPEQMDKIVKDETETLTNVFKEAGI
ncbi:MAG: tripartite tricarboxylate transporter substrate-binding protein [Alphaproteobacteria bacterium]|nr:tripartite tricarboxylate transporter substrate-binding protein [Alphaproteobacteria bacterium]